jgi:hypothetical protein
MMNTAPTAQQQVFQQETFSGMANSLKMAILVLIVGCNFVQVGVSFLRTLMNTGFLIFVR